MPSPALHLPAAAMTPTPSTMPHQELIGAVIGGKYQVRSLLGSGGMGSVFEAVHVGIGRHCAVKILNANQLQKKDAVRRFHHEARAAARIGHPNICEVYDLGTLEDGRPYLVMERLVGETWADCIAREGGLPFVDVIDVMRQVLSGLYAAHENGIIHRDIKPENVFLTKRVGCPPVAKLLDFGVSKMMTHHPQSKDDGDLEMTRTGIVLGTPYYLAPEQARGDRNLDARVDIYACGVMLYEALAGRRPFVAANYNALLIQILTGAPRPIHEQRKDIPEDLVLVLNKAMARERHQRYPNAIAFQSDLQQVELPGPPGRVSQRPNAASGVASSRSAALRPPSRPPSRPPPPEPTFVPPRAPQGPSPYASARPVRHRPSSSAEIDALMEMPSDREPPRQTPQRGSRARSKGGFDDQPTEVQLPPTAFLDDESTARGIEDVARGRARAHEQARVHRPGPTTGRQKTLLERKHPDFADDSKTDVMSPDLGSRIREAHGSSSKPRPHPPGHGRPRKG
jgi:serine/threonine protein kinase